MRFHLQKMRFYFQKKWDFLLYFLEKIWNWLSRKERWFLKDEKNRAGEKDNFFEKGGKSNEFFWVIS